MTQSPGRGYPQTGVPAFTSRQRAAVTGADSATPLDELTAAQASAVLGEPIPIVFCTRFDDVGGVWINPAATFARFESDANDVLTVRYHLILSDGELGGISSVWQGETRRAGPFPVDETERPAAVVEWDYDQRAGTWRPGMFITQNWKASTYVATQDVKGAGIDTLDQVEESKARLRLTSRSNYVTGFTVTCRMIDWAGRVTGGTEPVPRPMRNLGNWSFSRDRSTTEQRIELDHVEDVAFWGDPVPEATYRCTISEEGIEPGRIYEQPNYTGDTRGSYAGLSCMSYTDTYPPGNETWKQQVHVFIENGIQVPPLIDVGMTAVSSSLLPELANYLMLQRLPADLIDVDALTLAAKFCGTNQLLFNGIVAVPANLRDYLFRIAPFFMLRVSNRNGKIGLRPAVPTDPDGVILTGPVSPAFTFTQDHIIPGSFDQELIGLDERRPFIAMALWREQPLDEIGIPRATEVRYSDTDSDAPVEQYDLTEFCVTEDHAVKAMMYLLARRRHCMHRLSIDVYPDATIAALSTGDIVRVRYERRTAGPAAEVGVHDFFYWLDEIETSDEGAVRLSLTHFPVTDAQESVYAVEVVTGSATREGFTWSDSAAEYGASAEDPGAETTEDLDQYKDPPVPYDGVASFQAPVYDFENNNVLIKVCMDKPVETQDMGLRLSSQLIAFNNQRINIPVGQTCGEIELPIPEESGEVSLLGYTGGGFVDPDLSDSITVEPQTASSAGMVWFRLTGAAAGNASAWINDQVGSINDGIENDDTLPFAIGSGDGTQWVESSLSLPGVTAWQTAVDAFPSPPPLTTEPTISEGQGWRKMLVLPAGNGLAVCIVHCTFSAMAAYAWDAPPFVGATDTVVVSGDETVGPVQDTKAFLVGHTTCREIDVPATFLTQLNTVAPAGDWAGSRYWKVVITVSGITPSANDIYIPTVSSTPGPYWYTLGSGGKSRVFLDLIKGYPRTYGMMRSTMAASDDSYWMDMDDHWTASPAIYSFFSDPIGITTGAAPVAVENIQFQPPSVISDALASLTDPPPAPVGFVTPDVRSGGFQVISDKIIDGSDPDYPYDIVALYNDAGDLITDVSFAYLPDAPPDDWIGTTVAQTEAWEITGTLAFADASLRDGAPLANDGTLALVTHWDWNQPTYCRGALLALGFTEEDLTP